MKEDFTFIKKDFGEVHAYTSLSYEDRQELLIAMDRLSDFDKYKLNELVLYIDDNYEKIGFLGSILIEKDYRGQGKGKELMKEFEQKISSKTDVDILFARYEIPQNKGFNLLEFYKEFGFEPVIISNGEVLMVNKGKKNDILENAFGVIPDDLKPKTSKGNKYKF